MTAVPKRQLPPATLYAVLGSAPGETQLELHDAYLMLASQLHPDREGGDEEAFKRLTQAYSILKDPARRLTYDKQLLMDGYNCPKCNGKGRRLKALRGAGYVPEACAVCKGTGRRI